VAPCSVILTAVGVRLIGKAGGLRNRKLRSRGAVGWKRFGVEAKPDVAGK
jgi:hypothetical protein